jgi:GTP-binding protein
MKFIDIAKINVKAGDGGDGHVSFRKEKFVAKGGPNGGDGGDGGNVVLKTSKHINTLLDFKYKHHFEAESGAEGGKSNKTGKSGEDLIIKVPVGTLVKDTKENIICDLNEDSQEYIIAKGGSGGWGNFRFRSATNQTPRYAKPGTEGEEKELILELKLLADVGLVGMPNAGKSTLISVISAAKPKIADYPFTTLVPNLGVVKIGDYENYVVADIPGLIEGASEGKGLGHQFLRHVERTNVLVFLLDINEPDPENTYNTLKHELEKYNPEMAFKQRIICFSKSDSVDEATKNEVIKTNFQDETVKKYVISAVSHENIDKLKHDIWNMLKGLDD